MMRSFPLLLLASLVGGPVHAQAPSPLDDAVETITPADIRGRIEVLADDSMLGRDTPSPGLERAAKYVIADGNKVSAAPKVGEVRHRGVPTAGTSPRGRQRHL